MHRPRERSGIRRKRYGAVEGDRRLHGKGKEESYEPIVPVKVGNSGWTGRPTGGKGRTNGRIG
jgi:hypothetical protein